MTELLVERPYYFLHTFVGNQSMKHNEIMQKSGRTDWARMNKIDAFLYAPETPGGIEYALGLDLREVFCTVSKKSPAVTYHGNFGLVLDGAVKACFDNDSGRVLQDDGTYNDFVFSFTNRSTPEDLMGKWYDEYTKRGTFAWNEAILEKGSSVIGAFLDSSGPPEFPEMMSEVNDAYTRGELYENFVSKIRRCGLAILEIESIYQ